MLGQYVSSVRVALCAYTIERSQYANSVMGLKYVSMEVLSQCANSVGAAQFASMAG